MNPEGLFKKAIFLFGLVMTMCFLQTDLRAAETIPIGPIPTGELAEKAKKEGNITFYFSTPAPEGTALLEGFKKKYPFMKTDQYRSPSYKLWEKFKSEARGGMKVVDTMFCGGAAMVENIQFMTSYITSEHKNFEYKDSQNRWIAVRPFTASMMVSKAIPEAERPKDWLDWINPKPSWKGKVGVGDIKTLSYTYNTFYGLMETFGLDTLKKIMAGVKKCDPKIVLAATTATEAAITGEIPIVFDMLQDRWVAYAIERKAPLEWIYPPSGMIVYNMVAGVVKDAPHPYAARLFLTYMLSDDGQKVLSNMGYYVWSKAVRPQPYLRPLDKVKIIKVFDEVAAEAKREMLIDLWEGYFGK